MDYDQFTAIVDRCGLSNDPAITDPKLLVRIGELPPQYRQRALGLYYPEADERPSNSRLWVPADADEETVKHELGHRIGHYYHNDISEPFAESYRKQVSKSTALMRARVRTSPTRRAPALQSGQYTEIVDVNIPDVATPGTQVPVNVDVENIYSSQMHIYVVGVIENNNRFIDWQDAYLQPNQVQNFSGSFTMPDVATVVNIYIYYDGSDGYVYADSEAAQITINASDTYQIPSGYALGQYVFYPGSITYAGKTVQTCSFSFNAPLTIIPGVSWLVDQLLGAYVTSCINNGVIPIELKVYSQPGDLGSTNYIVQATATTSAATRMQPAMLLPIVWAVILAALVLAIGIALVFAIKAITEYRYGPESTTTTTTQPQTGTLNPGQSLAIGSGAATVTTGPNGGTVTNSSGATTSIPPNSVVVLGPGDTFVPKDTVTYTTAAQTTKTVAPSNPQGTDTISNVVKWVAIGGIIVAVSLVAIAAFQSFGKRQLYPVRA